MSVQRALSMHFGAKLLFARYNSIWAGKIAQQVKGAYC